MFGSMIISLFPVFRHLSLPLTAFGDSEELECWFVAYLYAAARYGSPSSDEAPMCRNLAGHGVVWGNLESTN